MPIPWDRYIPGGFQRRQPPLLPIAEARESPSLPETPHSQQNASECVYDEKSTHASYSRSTTSQQPAGTAPQHETIGASRRESFHPDPLESLNPGSSTISHTNEKDESHVFQTESHSSDDEVDEQENQQPCQSDASTISDSDTSTAVLPEFPLPAHPPNQAGFSNPFNDNDKNNQSLHCYNATDKSSHWHALSELCRPEQVTKFLTAFLRR